MIKAQILSNASRIRKYLAEKGEVSVGELRNQFQLRERDVFLALGWMASENKIYLREDEHQELTAAVFNQYYF